MAVVLVLPLLPVVHSAVHQLRGACGILLCILLRLLLLLLPPCSQGGGAGSAAATGSCGGCLPFAMSRCCRLTYWSGRTAASGSSSPPFTAV